MGAPTYTDTSGGVTERIGYDAGENRVVVQRSQDVTPIMDAVAKANLHGTTEVEGLGRLVAEVPIALAMQFCENRGIPWAKFLYGNEYDAEFRRFIAEHQRLAYTHQRRVFAS